jgi:hypothetical protein
LDDVRAWTTAADGLNDARWGDATTVSVEFFDQLGVVFELRGDRERGGLRVRLGRMGQEDLRLLIEE